MACASDQRVISNTPAALVTFLYVDILDATGTLDSDGPVRNLQTARAEGNSYLYIIKMAVRIPPQKMPIHMVGFCILCESHTPVASFLYLSRQPASSKGVDFAPVTAPIPALYVNPIRARYKPIPQPVASLIDEGIARASHCRIPRSDSAMKIPGKVSDAC